MVSPLPVAAVERIERIDMLRGLALLGILTMNVQDFAMPGQAYWNPTDYGDLHGLNLWVWAVTHTFADLKFMGIFGMLFGAGIVLMTRRVEAAGRSSAAVHYRRMGWLIVIGMLHAYLLWTGDILFTYGVCGMVVYLFRHRSPTTLVILGMAFLSVAPVIGISIGHSSWHWTPATVNSAQQGMWHSTPAAIAEHLATFRQGWRTQMETRVSESIGVETVFFAAWLFWRACGLMLIGMGLYKWGALSGKRPKVEYTKMIAVAVFVGIPITLYGTWRDFASGWDFRYSFFYGMQINYYASLLVSLGWIGAAMLAPFSSRLAAVGRTALSNYILQTVLCTLIFYGDGLGLIGKLQRTEQFAIVAAVWAIELLISPIWLRHFHYGPLEWMWRSLTYRRWEPLRIDA